MAKKHAPVVRHEAIRTCIATGVKKPKKEMIRIVRLPDSQVLIDASGKMRGRGANIDMRIEAFDLAIKKKAIEKALKLESNLTLDQITKLRADFLSAISEKQFRSGNKPVVVRVGRQDLDSE